MRSLALAGLLTALAGGCATSGKSGGVFPCVWSENGFALYPLYYTAEREGTETTWLCAGLTGWRSSRGRTFSDWLVPLYARGRDWFWTLPAAYFEHGRRGKLELFLTGLGGRDYDDRGKLESHWALPLYYHDRERTLVTVYGTTKTADWLLPFYYRDESWFANPLYASRRADETGDRQLGVPLGLTWMTWDAKGLSSLLTPLFGWTGGGTSQTNGWWATPLVGTRSGSREGGWLFPLYDAKTDPAFDAKARMLEADYVPADVVFREEALVDSRGAAAVRTVRNGSAASEDVRSYLLFFDDVRTLTEDFDAKSRRYACTLRRKVGNRCFFNWESERTVTFNAKDRWKLSDSGDAGYCHWSFLWRFFRYERHPSGETDLDLLFVPVMR